MKNIIITKLYQHAHLSIVQSLAHCQSQIHFKIPKNNNIEQSLYVIYVGFIYNSKTFRLNYHKYKNTLFSYYYSLHAPPGFLCLLRTNGKLKNLKLSCTPPSFNAVLQ